MDTLSGDKASQSCICKAATASFLLLLDRLSEDGIQLPGTPALQPNLGLTMHFGKKNLTNKNKLKCWVLWKLLQFRCARSINQNSLSSSSTTSNCQRPKQWTTVAQCDAWSHKRYSVEVSWSLGGWHADVSMFMKISLLCCGSPGIVDSTGMSGRCVFLRSSWFSTLSFSTRVLKVIPQSTYKPMSSMQHYAYNGKCWSRVYQFSWFLILEIA